MPATRRSPTRQSAPRRTGEPRKPVVPASLADAQQDLEPEAALHALGFSGSDLSGREAEAVELAQCRFRGADLSGSVLAQLTMTDCLVQTSNWANVRSDGGALRRVIFEESRMTGFAVTDGKLGDVTFAQCRLDLSGWRFTGFDNVHFTGCNLTGADFTNADLRGARFTGCDLTGAQFHHATMDGARFRRCELDGIAGITSWRGAIVHPDDLLALSYTLAGGLGIKVDPED
ncbi:pentapeptide repeat-containing protein [Actinoplanes sp. ATCC 53533]|uniref:pentapeptide repeat-containing protein n=1 Tax=Actinoplanes sp. ATCC 53533 TaxID=1288362 RepID=UPI000F7701A4|nr:pentapeptide repeat-containing protein [Actinoplanes sp. ATCC 53533]RSM64942.1 pentapeptide repeat-containing protein [Actinoplanes sp. ATCC 53533]